MLRALRQERQRDAQKTVKSEFFQHARHAASRQAWARRRRLPAPRCETGRAKSECRSRSAAAGRSDSARRPRCRRLAASPAARGSRSCALPPARCGKAGSARAAERSCRSRDRSSLSRRRRTDCRSPDADEEKSGNQRELMKGVEEKKIERSESADRAAREKEKTGVKEPLGFLDRRGEPDGAEQDQSGKEKHDQRQAIRA